MVAAGARDSDQQTRRSVWMQGGLQLFVGADFAVRSLAHFAEAVTDLKRCLSVSGGAHPTQAQRHYPFDESFYSGFVGMNLSLEDDRKHSSGSVLRRNLLLRASFRQAQVEAVD